MKNKYLVISSIIVVLLTGLCAAFIWLDNVLQAKVIVVNKSAYSIESVEIEFSDQKLNLSKIRPNSRVTRRIDVPYDGHFYIKILFADGSIIEENDLGYVTNGERSNSTFHITEEKILEFSQEY